MMLIIDPCASGVSRARLFRLGASTITLAAVLASSPVIAQTQAETQSTPAPADSPQAPAGAAPTVIRPSSTNTAQSSSPDGQGTPIDNVAGTTEEAQTNPTETTADDVVVTGYRQALQSAQNLKRNSDAIVDSVTAEDIGALPDRSVVETLQRIPGVSISRFAAGVDPDHFSVEGSGATVRGLTYVRSEFNGREAFSALNGRSLGFQDVASELLGGVDVFKSPTADRIEGGISGIVNLRTRKPFDSNASYLAGTLEANYGDFVKKSAPTVSVLGSTRWNTGIGDIGILGSFVYSQLFTRNDRLQLSSFRNRPIFSNGTRTDVVAFDGATQQGTGLFPRGAVQGSQEFDRERYGYSGALQWRSNDGSMEAAFQFLRSDARQAWTENVVEIATDNVTAAGDSRARAGTSISFDEDNLFSEGLISGPTGWRADQQVPAGPFAFDATGAVTQYPAGRRTPAFGLQSNNQFREHLEQSVTDDYGFNFKWDVNERLGLVVDYSHVESRGEVIDNTLWGTTYQDAFIRLNGKDLPDVQFVRPQTCETSVTNAQGVCTGVPGSDGNNPTYLTGAGANFADPSANFWRSAMDHAEESKGNSDAFRIDGELSFPDSSFLKSVRAGYRYADRDQIAKVSTYNWGVLSEQWGNGGPVWLDEQVGGVGNDQQGTVSAGSQARPYFFGNFFRGQIADPSGGQGRLFYSGRPASDYASYIAFSKSIRDEFFPAGSVFSSGGTGWVPLAERPGVVDGYYLPNEINPISETNHAGYIMARFDSTFGNGWRLNGNIGVRYSDTKRTSSGAQGFASADTLTADATCATSIQTIVNPQAGQTPPATPTIGAGCAFLYSNPQLRANLRSFINGGFNPPIVSEVSYDYWLPSFNVKLEVGGGLQFRAAFFKGISPPGTRGTLNGGLITAGPVVDAGQVLTVVPNLATPDLNDGIIQNEGVVRIEGSGVRIGSPNLLPVTADNFDLTAEWYFSKVGSLTFSAFYKEIKGVVVFDTSRQDFTNNGQTYSVVTTSEVNSPDTGKVKGFEAAYQQTYDFLPGPLAGLGLQANYTYVKSSGVPQPTLSPGDPTVSGGQVSNLDVSGFPLQGLSKHQFNVTPFLDFGALSMRASYSWRSRFLVTTRDVITPFDPVFQEAYGQLDASIFVQATPKLRLGFQGVNLTNSITKTSVAVQGPDGADDIRIVPRGWFMNDRRISAIARFSF